MNLSETITRISNPVRFLLCPPSALSTPSHLAVSPLLARRYAEAVHRHIRTEAWAYSPGEALTAQDLHRATYDGIRPAPGYPSQPDHSEKATMWELLRAEEAIGMKLVETSYAMTPAASVCALVFSHPQSQYFALSYLGKDQVESYARRKGITVQAAERSLGTSLGYTPEGC